MVKKSFTCSIYKIVDTGTKTFTLMIKTYDVKHKTEIYKKLRSLGMVISHVTPNNKIVKLTIQPIDFERGDNV